MTEATLRKLIDNLPIGCIVMHFEDIEDPASLRIVLVNKASEKAYGIKASKSEGRLASEVYSNMYDTLDFAIKAYRERVVGKGETVDFGIIEYGDEKVEKSLFEFSAHPLEGNYFYITFRNVTEKQLLSSEVEEKDRMLRSLMQNLAGVVYRCTPDMDWLINYVSEGCLKLTGYTQQEFENKYWSSIVHPDDLAHVRKVVSEGMQHKGAFEIEYRIIRKNGSVVHVVERGSCYLDELDNVVALEGLIVDVTQRETAKQMLAISEKKYRDLYENSPVGMITTKNRDRTVLNVNTLAMSLFGYDTKADFLEHFIAADVYVDPEVRLSLLKQVQKEGEVKDVEIRYKRRNGEIFWALVSVKVDMENKNTDVAVIDITALKQAKQRTKRAFVKGQEQERKRVAIDLHDQMGQELVGLRLIGHNVSRSLKRKADSEGLDCTPILEEMNKLSDGLKQAIHSVRELSQELHPIVLQEMGIEHALKVLVGDFGTKHQRISFTLGFDERRKALTDEQLNTTIYRLVQEGLNNVTKHSQAQKALVRVTTTPTSVDLLIRDDGVGYNDDNPPKKGLGIYGMRERVNAFHGNMTIKVNGGTEIRINIPLS